MLGRKSFEDRLVTVSLENLVPKDDFLRQVSDIVDVSFIPDLVAGLYSPVGRPSIDPVVVIKILLIGFLYGITSERRLMREIHVNLSYRLFVGYHLDEALPDHSSLTKIRDRLGRETFQAIFDEIVRQCMCVGLVSGKHLSCDCTLVAANASMASMTPRLNTSEFTQEVFESNPVENGSCDDVSGQELPTDEVPEENTPVLHLAPPFPVEGKRKKRGYPLSNATHVSKTDPDATLSKDKNAMMTKLSYKDNLVVDSFHRIVLDCTGITGCQDEAMDLLGRLYRIRVKFGIWPKEVSADKKYGTEKNFVGLEEAGISGFIPTRKTGENTMTGLYALDRFKYDQTRDVMICPAGHKLVPKPYLVQERFRLFLADKDTCLACSQRNRCTRIGKKRQTGRALNVSIYAAYVQRARERTKSVKGKRAHTIRKTTVETIFGEGKMLHGLTRARWRGLIKVHIQFLLTATCQNIKRMVTVLTKKRKGANVMSLCPWRDAVSWLFLLLRCRSRSDPIPSASSLPTIQ